MTIRVKHGDTRPWVWTINTDLTDCGSAVGLLRQTPLNDHDTVPLALVIADAPTGTVAYQPDGTEAAGVHYFEVELHMNDGTVMTAPTTGYERIEITVDLGDSAAVTPPTPPTPSDPTTLAIADVQPDPIPLSDADATITITGLALDTDASVSLTSLWYGSADTTLQGVLDIVSATPTELVFTVPVQFTSGNWPVMVWTLHVNNNIAPEVLASVQFVFDRADTKPYHYYVVPEVAAEDTDGAALLSSLGFVADPMTLWSEGDHFTVVGSVDSGGTPSAEFHFYWDGAAWQPGSAPAGG